MDAGQAGGDQGRASGSPIRAAIRPAASRCCGRWSTPACCRPTIRVTVNAVSGYSGGGSSMIEAYEGGTAPAFELYGARPRAQACARAAELFRADAAADLRAVGRQFPSGHAGRACRCTSTRCRASRRPPTSRRRSRRTMPASKLVQVVPAGDAAAKDGGSSRALNDTDLLELRVFANEKHRPGGAGGAARQPRQGRLGRGGAEHRPDAGRGDLIVSPGKGAIYLQFGEAPV